MSRRLREKRERRREQCYQAFPTLRPRLLGTLADLFGDDPNAALAELRDHKLMRPMAITVSADEQAVIDHNRAKYAELEKLRMGQPNRYAEMRYRS